MPTALRSGPYRFFFYAGDRHEPPHVHVERDASKAKFWLQPVFLQSSAGFSRSELNDIQRLIVQNHALLLQRWHDYFDT
jgi:5-enolpyruvylshikimate-3-phosphate synthase